jgi:hypothetical protein
MVERSRERDQDGVDRGAGVTTPSKVGDQGQDVIDSDLVESMPTQERKDMTVETPCVVLDRTRPY